MDNTQESLSANPSFLGTARSALDSKNRFTVPAGWREDGKKGSFFVLKSPNRPCISFFPRTALHAFTQRAASTSPTPAEYQRFLDFFYSSVVETPFDTQGRLVLSDELRSHTAIQREIILTGSGEKFDGWSPQGWEAHSLANAPGFALRMANLGL